MASDMFDFYLMPDAWVSTSSDGQLPVTDQDYQRYPMSSMNTSLETPMEMNNMITTSNSVNPAPSMFKAVNAPGYGQNMTAVSPEQTLFQFGSASPTSHTNTNFGPKHTQMSANSSQSAYDSRDSTLHQSSVSSQTSLDPESPPRKKHRGGRKPRTEDVDPDSARATYLEKNRKAASKCRSKQKRQQDDLVEQAREVGRRNKCWKAEVAMLQGGMRELMDMVGQHTACSDTRLQQYVQREADRLAAGTSRTSPLIEASENLPIGRHG